MQHHKCDFLGTKKSRERKITQYIERIAHAQSTVCCMVVQGQGTKNISAEMHALIMDGKEVCPSS